jgi:N-acetylneuraminate synthase
MSNRAVRIGDANVGNGSSCRVVAKIGKSHNGDVGLAKRLVEAAARCGCYALSLHAGSSSVDVVAEQSGLFRTTPWSMMPETHAEQRAGLGPLDYVDLDIACREQDILWFASCEDRHAVDMVELFDPPCFRVQCASLGDRRLLRRLRSLGRPVILATQDSALRQLDEAVDALGTEALVILHTDSAQRCCHEEVSLRRIAVLQQRYGVPVGYSGNDADTAKLAASKLGAAMVELDVTLDRPMWGSDDTSSLEPWALTRLVRELRTLDLAAPGSGSSAA